MKEYSEKGYEIIIVGDKNHPEVIGISGWCDNNCFIVSDNNELEKLLEYNYNFPNKKITAVAQTTFNANEWIKCQKTCVYGLTNPKNRFIIFSYLMIRKEFSYEICSQQL